MSRDVEESQRIKIQFHPFTFDKGIRFTRHFRLIQLFVWKLSARQIPVHALHMVTEVILILAWISRVVMCYAHRTGLGQAVELLNGTDRGNKETQSTPRVALPLTGSPPQSFTFTTPMLVATKLSRVFTFLSVCVCVCVRAVLAPSSPRRLCVGTHREPTPPRWGLPAPW